MSNSDGVSAAPPPVPATPTKSSPQKLPRWVSAVIGVVFLTIGLSKLYNVFFPSLPGCDADTINGLIHKIFKDKNVELTSLGNFKTITNTSTQKSCQADVMTPKEAGVISYQIRWQESSIQVLITHVDTHAR